MTMCKLNGLRQELVHVQPPAIFFFPTGTAIAATHETRREIDAESENKSNFNLEVIGIPNIVVEKIRELCLSDSGTVGR